MAPGPTIMRQVWAVWSQRSPLTWSSQSFLGWGVQIWGFCTWKPWKTIRNVDSNTNFLFCLQAPWVFSPFFFPPSQDMLIKNRGIPNRDIKQWISWRKKPSNMGMKNQQTWRYDRHIYIYNTYIYDYICICIILHKYKYDIMRCIAHGDQVPNGGKGHPKWCRQTWPCRYPWTRWMGKSSPIAMSHETRGYLLRTQVKGISPHIYINI